MRSPGRMRRAALAAVMTAPVVLLFSGCAVPTTPADRRAPCSLELTATPGTVTAGEAVTIRGESSCSLSVAEGDTWTVRAHPSDWSTPFAEAEVSPAADGSFGVDLIVPPGAAPGHAFVIVEGYERYVECDDTDEGFLFGAADSRVEAACAAPSTGFEVTP